MTEKKSRPQPIKFAFFGSSRFSILVLDELERLGFFPACVITLPDMPRGRGHEVSPNIVKSWAAQREIKVFTPSKLDTAAADDLRAESCDVFVVASYGKIIPAKIIDLPPHKMLNIHPSLLPNYRGPSPLQTAMLQDAKQTGVTIMRIDEKIDHGPIVAQAEVTVNEWPTYEEFEEMMAHAGAKLLADVLPKWVSGMIKEREQDHSAATTTKWIKKEDGLIDFANEPYSDFRKIQAFHQWPSAYFLVEHRGKMLRVKIAKASFERSSPQRGILVIERVLPEGAREMSYADFLKGYAKTAKS